MQRYRMFGWAAAMALVLVLGSCSRIPPVPGINQSKTPTREVFGDILIPGELGVRESESFLFEAGNFKAGTLILAGYVDVDSVGEFFQQNMPKDGWTLRSIFRFPKMVFLFEKQGKVAIVEIYESNVLTYVEIWVAPTL